METIRVVRATYSQKGHYMYPEDTWESSHEVSNERDLFKIMKCWHKESARSFNNYPFNGYNISKGLDFQQREFITIGEQTFYTEWTEVQDPEFAIKARERYHAWVKVIEERLPKLIEARKKRLKEEKDRATFERLKNQFEVIYIKKELSQIYKANDCCDLNDVNTAISNCNKLINQAQQNKAKTRCNIQENRISWKEKN